jgi:hypothetical protein
MVTLGDSDDGLGRQPSKWWSSYPPSAFPKECRRTDLSQVEKVYCDKERRGVNVDEHALDGTLGLVGTPAAATWWALGATSIAVVASVWMLVSRR